MAKYIYYRMNEASTWKGLIMLFTSIGVLNISNDQAESLISAGLALAGIVGTFFPDKVSL